MAYTRTKVFDEDLINTLYYALYAKYGNSAIASSDPNQFKYKVFLTIFQYAPTWKTKLQVQEKLFAMDVDGDAVQNGTTAFYNHAENPDTAPATDSYQTLGGINSQNTTQYKRGKLEGYTMLLDLLETDVTEEMLNRFKKLFLQVLMPQKPLWYGPVEGDDSTADIPDINSSLYGNYRTNTFQQIWPNVESFLLDYDGDTEHGGMANGIPRTI